LLLTSAGLAYRSISLIGTRDLGFVKDRLLLATITTTGAATTHDGSVALIERIRERVRAAPGVRSASYARFLPTMPGTLWPDGGTGAPGGSDSARAWINDVGPDYLRALGITPLAGREIPGDDRGAPETAMINRDLADTLWPGQSAVGRTLLVGADRQAF